MLFHKRQDLANPARKPNSKHFLWAPRCPLTKPSSTRIKLFNYGFWGHFSRFARAFMKKHELANVLLGGTGAQGCLFDKTL